MTLQIIFVISGIAIGTVIWSKISEDGRVKKPALLRLISLGDEHARILSHEVAHKYFEFKEDADFFINKELPFRTRSFINKTNTTVKERIDKHVGDIRGSKFLKKSDGISEFLKSISEKENGRIDDTLDDPEDSQNTDKKVE